MKKKMTLSVTEFALPAPRRGSIDIYSGFGRGMEVGVEIHQELQLERKAEFPMYKAEVPISKDFEWGGYQFEILGRIDGLFDEAQPKIEEIKSCFNVYELLRKLKEARDEHPYILQLKTYGYFYWLEHNKVPDLCLTIVSSRNRERFEYGVSLSISQYENWLERRSLELIEEAKAAEKRSKRRIQAAKDFVFPFEKPRAGQVELIQTIEAGIEENRPMMIQAPTGLGKTVGVMYPTMKEALTRGQKLVYVTPKNSQHTVAEDAVERLQEKGATVKSLTLTAKSKMCFKNEPLCNPDFCEYAKDHYTKVAENNVIEQLNKKKKLTAKKFRAIAEKYQVCPFEIQLDAAQEADAVICDYNYVFAPRSAFGRLAGTTLGQTGKPNLVIDEAHNLPSRSMDYYSPSLSVSSLEFMMNDLVRVPTQFQDEFKTLLQQCISVVAKCGPKDCQKACKINAPVTSFIDQDAKLRSFVSTYLNSDINIEPKDPVLKLSFYWSEFTNALEFVSGGHDEFFTTFHPYPATVKITCCDASQMLKASYDDYDQVVAFSATLKPFDFYSQLGGLSEKNLKTAEFTSPFPESQRKVLIIPQISSKYSERAKNYPKIADAVQKITSLKRGNYFVFFPSFDFMERVFQAFVPPAGFQVLKQERHMKKDDIDTVIEQLKEHNSAYVLFAVQGGVFSEGVDYPGDMIIGAFVVGPPLPNFDLEREKMKEYYQENYQEGFDYAYTYPAMAKAVQAAGRVIRSETDRGIIVLMDNRFIQASYSKSMPSDWFKDSPRELISDKILSDIRDFWARSESSTYAPHKINASSSEKSTF